jgi:hypothetical protein
MRLFLPYVFYTVGVSPIHVHMQIIVKKLLGKRKKKKRTTEKKDTTAQIGTNVRVRGFNAGLLACSQFASGES